MFKNLKFWAIIIVLIPVVAIFSCAGGYIGIITAPKEVADCPVCEVCQQCQTTCTPCIDEPVFEKCKFESFAYEALKTKYDIYGQPEIIKGDKYFLKSEAFYKDFDGFCTDDEKVSILCFDFEKILDKNLFKPLE
jgi:hypothetical protein